MNRRYKTGHNHCPKIDSIPWRLITVNMKNITVSVDDKVYYRARIRAAEQRTSVSAIVRRLLSEVAEEETEAERLMKLEEAAVKQIEARKVPFSAGNRLSREHLHERGALS
jgi:plasmid stability protein